MRDIHELLPIEAEAQESSLPHSAFEALAQLELSKIRNAGIWRHRDTYFLNIAYPSLQAMGEVNELTVYDASHERINESPRRVGLYVHIPYCTAECYYCHYYKVFGASEEEVSSYIDTVDQELAQHERREGAIEAASIYIGGGTPSYLREQQIKKLFASIHQHIKVNDRAEVSFEMHPESATEEKLAMLKSVGVNRINLGVESFNDELLKGENRRHTAADAINAYHRIRKAGFDNVNLDLIYGLKGHTVQLWEKTLNTLASIQPPSATLYYLRLKQGTPEYQLWKRYPSSFPSDEALLLMHAMNLERMEKQSGYIQKPVDWFIRDAGIFHTYQDINWRRSDETELLGIGASAYSYVNGWQYYNVNDTGRYIQAVRNGNLPIWRGERLDKEESMRRTIMLGIKIGMDRNLFMRTYRTDVYQAFQPTWNKLQELGLIEITDQDITLTYAGALFADEVGQQFYSEKMKRRMSIIDPHLVSTTWPQFNA